MNSVVERLNRKVREEILRSADILRPSELAVSVEAVLERHLRTAFASQAAEIERLTKENVENCRDFQASFGRMKVRAETAERLLAEARGKALDEAAASVNDRLRRSDKNAVSYTNAGIEGEARTAITVSGELARVHSIILALKDTQPLSGEKEVWK